LKKRTIAAVDSNDVSLKKWKSLLGKHSIDVKYNAAGEEVKFKKKDIDYVLNEFLTKKIGYDYYIEFREFHG